MSKRDHAAAFAILHDEVESEVLDEKIRFVPLSDADTGCQHGMAARSAAAQVRCAMPLPKCVVMPPNGRW